MRPIAAAGSQGPVLDPSHVLAAIEASSAAQMQAENFPVALRLLPRAPRAHLARIYAFARLVDDVGDEAPGDRLQLLDLIDADVRSLWSGGAATGPTTAQLPTIASLRPTVQQCALPIQPLLDLIEANRVDQHTTSYASFTDLLGYCRLSAAPIGRLVLAIAGAADELNVADSDSVCAGLQVLEHCQDVGEDARAGRVYLPGDDLQAAGVAPDELRATVTSAALRAVVATQVERSLELIDTGRPLVRRLSGWSKLAVAGYVAGGLATAAALRRADYHVLEGHVGASKPRTALLAARLMVGR